VDKQISERFFITFRTIEGSECRHAIVTYMGEPKAVAVAALTHQFIHPELHIFTVHVEAAGEAQRDARGAYMLEDDDVTDRNEW
jgi:hypothetical protein